MKTKEIEKIRTCRISKKNQISDFLKLGDLPIPNGFLRKEELTRSERRYPLTVSFCHNCGLVQLRYIVNPQIMFQNYLYIPSSSRTRMEHFEELVNDAGKRAKLTEESLVIDIGSNDGSLLNAFKNKGVRVLGVDPAANLVTIAELNGIQTICNYFTKAVSQGIVRKHGNATVITATNVFAHVSNLHAMLDAIENALADDGVFIAQFPYLADLIRENQFDTIYHEHLSYFSLKSLVYLTDMSRLEIIDVVHKPLDGGSVRVYWKKKGAKKTKEGRTRIKQTLETEEKSGLYVKETYQKFAHRIELLKGKTIKKLTVFKHSGKHIVGYGAAAKGNILVNYYGIDHSLLDYVVDSTPYKQGLYTPGTHIRVFPEGRILETMPDYVLILAWNFKEEIMEKNTDYKKRGGKFILPVPDLKIV